ncbi:hypothetical protein, conserved [Trypanosoma brucei gambiense DAL972]|uniref:Ribosomal RNA methyltransferase FtsJ domain-containing protein n=1 Tax=Trypanosoma brucei gambiense (strain MHOM/CI/86/DAL972) TaxID=679716 RepID=C9ZX64_TRYB9|nr:hypothetical protein, conserved [Trypanosoma brucei gambiense DAL972]CBH14008.1 hypothetical protein, conserved [Trypanosoma brucei gambiense DAL972]|eukprot:XP_011776279.1 hypothetical protein, conserved [Trypanosoma brucei gambiense DAL972]
METPDNVVLEKNGQTMNLNSAPVVNSGSSRCCRWRDYLLTVSTAYRALIAERDEGWRSEALDMWYQRRQRHSTQGGPEEDSKKASSGTHVAPVTSFARTDVSKLCQRYCDHAKRVLRTVAPEYFCTAPPALSRPAQQSAGDATAAPTFLDLGCAPGGVSKYLVTELRWSGIGVSLPVDRGGIAFDSSWRNFPTSKGRFELIEGSILEEDWQQHRAIKGRDFYFVNGGAVQDYGQREEETSGDSGELPTNDGHPVLPWFSFLVPQLQIAVKHVRDGGVIMFVFGRPECASFPILLAHLRPLVAGSIHIMETMHAAKTPVYVLLTGVRVTRTMGTCEAWDRLLKLLTEGSREYWLGNTDESLELARVGFQRHRLELEKVWERSFEFLQRRRRSAERAMQWNEGGRTAKRTREEDAR